MCVDDTQDISVISVSNKLVTEIQSVDSSRQLFVSGIDV